jgi:hypothetical protein
VWSYFWNNGFNKSFLHPVLGDIIHYSYEMETLVFHTPKETHFLFLSRSNNSWNITSSSVKTIRFRYKMGKAWDWDFPNTQGSVIRHLRHIALILRHFLSRVKDKAWWDEAGNRRRWGRKNIRKMLDAVSPWKWSNNIPKRRLPVAPNRPILSLSFRASVLSFINAVMCLKGTYGEQTLEQFCLTSSGLGFQSEDWLSWGL